MQPTFKLDDRKFKAAVGQLAALAKTKPVQTVMRQAAGQVVKRVVSVTPPAKGKADIAAKKAGELTIDNDIAKLMVGAAKRVKRELQNPASLHTKSRDSRTGRVNPRSRKVKAAVEKAALNELRRKLKLAVGTLAAGWNAAAQELGVKLPAWIARHGTKHGIIKVQVSKTGIRIYLANTVGFVDNIPDLERRLQWAVNVVAKNIIEKQLPKAVRNAGKRAGFKARR